MKAAVIERAGELVVRHVPTPSIGPYDALCELLYGAVCSGTDQHLIAGRFPWPVHYPTVLGHESIGRVVEVGPKVRHLALGDLVTRVGVLPSATGEYHVNWGGFAERGVARDFLAMAQDGLPPGQWREHRANRKLPGGSDPAAGTMVITWRETLSYIQRLGVRPGSRVLVLGSGGTGLAFAAHAANLGAQRVAMVGHPNRESVARQAGVAAFHDYRGDGLAEAVGDQFDCLIDAVGKSGQVDRVLPLLRPGGTVGIYGIDDHGRCPINPHRARGTFTVYGGGHDESETHEEVLAYIHTGRLDARLWLDLANPLPLDEIGRALDAVRQRRVVKALIRLSPE